MPNSAFSPPNIRSGTSLLLSSPRHAASTTASARTTTSGHNFLTFLAVTQFYKVDILPCTWEFALDNAAPSGTAKIYESCLDVNRSFVFKRTRITNPMYHGQPDAYDDTQTYDALVSEISIACHPLLRQHPFIAKMKAISWEISEKGDGVWPVIVLDKAPLGDLDYFMNTEAGNGLEVEKKLHLCADIASAIVALHSCNGIHGDIKPHNVFVSICSHGKILAQMADFGWSFLPHEGDENAIFKPAESPPWSAPEYHHRGFSIEQGQKQDVFSFGMLCFWVLFHAELSAEARNSLNEKGDTNFAAQQSKHVYSLLGEWKREKKLQAVALDMVAVRFNNTRKEILTQFFKITLAHDPNERHRDFERLENLFKQLLPKRAVPRLQHSAQICPPLNSMYPVFKIVDNFFLFIEGDYLIRKYLADRLEGYANSISGAHVHYRNTTFQLAFCYYLGFGVTRNAEKAQYWVQKSEQSIERLEEQIDLIRKSKSPRLFRSDPLMSVAAQGLLNGHSSTRRYGMSESWIPEKPVLLKEIEDLASVFGEGHIAVQQLQYSLSVRFQREGLFEDAEATQIEEIEVLLKDSGLIQYRRNLETLEAPTTQNSASKPLPLAIKMPQSMNSSPVLHRIGLFAGRFHPLMARSMDNLVNIFIHQSRWTEAEWLCIHVREVFLCLDGEHHLNTLHSTFKLGQIYWEQGRWNEAERTYRYALDLCKDSLGEEHWQTLEIWEKLIQLYQNGDYHGKDTEELLTSYLNVELKKSKINEPERYSRVKKSATLEEQFQKMARKISISESPDMSVVADMGKIAILYSQQRRFKEAEEMLHQLIEICEKGLPQDHLETLTFMHQLAKLWIGQKHWNAAESLLKEVVERRNRVLGKRAIASLDAANDLAATYLNLNRLREGGILLQETLAAQKEVHGENHPKTLITLIKLAFLYSKCGKLKDAVELLEDTLERQKGVLGEEHRNVFDSSSFLAQLYIAEERYDEAETLCRSLIVRQEKLPKPEYPMVLDSMLGLATCFAAQKRYRDATLVVERYSTISTQIFGDTSKQALIGLLHLGVLYYREERWEEGKKVHQAALNLAKAELGLDDQLTKEIARGLAFGNKAKWPES